MAMTAGHETAPALDRTGGVALYRQLEHILLARIRSGEWPPGTRLPTETELCDRYAVSRVTIRQALARLVAAGVIAREPGRGTFVLAAGRPSPTREGALALALEPVGDRPRLAHRLIEQRVVVAAADRRAAEALAVPPTARLLRLRRLEAGNGRPVGLEVYLVPLDRFPGLDTVDLDQVSLTATLRDRFGCAVRTVSEIYTAGLLGPVEAELLDCPANEPVVQLEQVATDDRGPVTYLRGLYPGDRCRLSVVRRLA